MDLPPAPTPPISGGNGGSNSDRPANLLSLLKFSTTSNATSQHHQSQQSQQSQQSRDLDPEEREQECDFPDEDGDEDEDDDDDDENDVDENDVDTDKDDKTRHRQSQQLSLQSSMQAQNQNQIQNQNSFPTRIHQPAPTGADPSGLLAALMRGAHDLDEPKPLAPLPPTQPTNMFANSGSPSSDTRSYLLNLLNRPKPSQTDQPLLVESARRSSEVAHHSPDPSAEASRFLGPQHHQHQPVNAYHAYQTHQPESSETSRPSNVNSFPYSQIPSVQEPADMSVIYQQWMGSLNQTSPHNNNSTTTTTNNNNKNNNNNNSSSSTGGGSVHGSVHGSAHGSAAPPFHILSKEQNSPPGGPFEQSRVLKDRSPLTSPPGQTLSIERTSSLHSHHSLRSARHSAKQTPPVSSDGQSSSSFVPVDKRKETVSEALSDFAPQAESIGQRLDKADPEPAVTPPDNTLRDEGYERNETSAGPSGDALHVEKHLIDRLKSDHDQNQTSSSSDELPAVTVQETSQDIADDGHGVADNWENAEQEEAVVVEEKQTPVVKVFNFPMKPWISISLQDDATEPRPRFRDESIMDIARLKKDFDQMDRNLYTASQTYMTYGMSKQGGLRVIRQDDGKDAKVFTDTKDRVFNVAMSVTPSDHDGLQREAIIGTGVSGTVYWVQIKDGEKDHIEDYLEQYGFALPPISSPDGDAPGGALKTRARASTIHPEYFAVGRGKSINFIWPSYIMQNKLFKSGHERLVDTEALLDSCSLKINTGKAGKDFTFSQDDTAIVSLDKSGRVKFWDVRELAAAKEGSESLPLPAYSSFEVSEPLMTLSSTPEGEKAWPTSVLLLDKQRPYQKRCALRYMIVGMKQNHTLQLWDLALGKPVQEFNLPHSKESDAVCSVMYHPGSGMIIIGHPTRNSVYFAHLSAPKYNLKSVSQAEYIQRLVAGDPSIPQPDSTAVISGVREYSFANRGILRSLDILANPAMVHDADAPTLFELYAMHSKGVACLLIRHAELGWSKDNKVVAPVDAVAKGVVTVSKLKVVPQTEVVQPSSVPETAPVRAFHRTGAKDGSLQSTPGFSEATPRGAESVTPVKVKNDHKEAETLAQSSKEHNGEKPERKQRKKKNKDADTVGNGSPNKVDVPKGANSFAPAGMSPESIHSAMYGVEVRLGTALSSILNNSLSTLYEKVEASGYARDEDFRHQQLKLLDLVSEVLNDNTQNVLEENIRKHFADVIPSISDKTGKAVSDHIQHKLQPNLISSVQKEVQNGLNATNQSLRSKEFIGTVADRVTKAVSANLQQDVTSTLIQQLTPTLTSIVNQSSQRIVSEVHQRYHEQFEQLLAQRAADSNKIDQLLSYVSRLTDMVSTMAASQSSLQAEFLKLKQQPVELPVAHGLSQPHPLSQPHHQPHPQAQASNLAHSMGSMGYGNNIASPRGSYPPSQPPSQAPSHSQQYLNSPHYTRGSQHVSAPSQHGSTLASEHVGPVTNVSALAGAYAHQMSKTEAEADHDLIQRIRVIEGAIQEGRLQDALIQWIQSGREEEIFRRSLSRYPASKFEHLPPLMLLVVIATLSKELKPNARLKEEVEWIEMAVRAFAAHLPTFRWDTDVPREIMQSTLQTMQLLINRVQPLIAGIQDGFPTDPFLANVELGKLDWILRTSQSMLESLPHH